MPGSGVEVSTSSKFEGAEAEFFADVERCRNLLARTRAIAMEVHPERIDPHRMLYALDQAGLPVRKLLIGIPRPEHQLS
jgi:hypothetical protein